jgi:hypothetical protein
MKLDFPQSKQWFRFLLAVLFGLILVPLGAAATDSIYINTGTINGTPPSVDATNFFNSGTWNINTAPYPYTTSHTLNYTNTGTMIGSVGWEFDYGPLSNGGRGMANSFFNDTRGTIQAGSGSVNSGLVSYLLVSATNLINKGTIIGDDSGEVVLTASNMNLARSSVIIGTGSGIASQCSFNFPPTTNYLPDTAIYDEYWGTNGVTMNSSNLWDGFIANTPIFTMDEICAISNVQTQFGFFASKSDYITNVIMNPTNGLPDEIFGQAVFIAVNDPNISLDDRFFANSGNTSNLFETITVKLTSSLGGSLYLADSYAASTNHELLRNASPLPVNNPISTCTDPTARPASYFLARGDCQFPPTFASGSPGLGPPPANFLFNSSFSNVIVQGGYAAYSAYVDDLVRHPLNEALTNLPGRILINATNLDLTRATVSSDGAEVVIRGDNFIGSTGAVVSCRNVSYNLGSTSHSLNVTNLNSATSVPGFHGTLNAWSSVWTNGLIVVTGSGTNITTNVISVVLNALMVDATGLTTTEPVTVQDLILQTNAVNMLLGDSVTVVHTLFFGGQSLTLDGSLGLSGTNLEDWNRIIAPNLLYFTNNGSLSVPQNAHFGDDGPINYAAFVNNGGITVGGSETINSAFYQSSGNENAPGGYFVTTASGKIENASITSSQVMDFSGGLLKLDNSTLSAGNQLNFTLTNALYDSGASANNTLTCGAGFNLWVKPALGDLLGTALTSEAFNGAEVDSVWAGQDYGPTPAGYSNNVELGQLILSPQGASSFPAFFFFSGATTGNALYVDLLDLSHITNLSEMLGTDTNIVIYYAAAKLPPAITVLSSNGVPQQAVETNNALNGQSYYVIANGGSGQVPKEAEELLNGQLGGHLRWVPAFAGPNSSVDVIINGQTVAVNQALRYSLSIDSNGNGIPNGLDPNPFDSIPVVLTGSLVQTPPPTRKFAITWLAQTNLPYQVQYTANLSGTNWLPLLNYTNTGATNATVTVWDTNALSSQRFYRVGHP